MHCVLDHRYDSVCRAAIVHSAGQTLELHKNAGDALEPGRKGIRNVPQLYAPCGRRRLDELDLPAADLQPAIAGINDVWQIHAHPKVLYGTATDDRSHDAV